MNSMIKQISKALVVSALVASTMSATPAQAQTPTDPAFLQGIAQFFLDSTGQRLRTTYSRSWILLLQRTPPLAAVTQNLGGSVCLNTVLPAARNNLGCNPADRNCANTVNTALLRELLLLQLSLNDIVALVNTLPASTGKTNLTNNTIFQTAVVRRVLANVLADSAPTPLTPFVNFSTLVARATPTAASPLRARIEAGSCDINDFDVLQVRPATPPNDNIAQSNIDVLRAVNGVILTSVPLATQLCGPRNADGFNDCDRLDLLVNGIQLPDGGF